MNFKGWRIAQLAPTTCQLSKAKESFTAALEKQETDKPSFFVLWLVFFFFFFFFPKWMLQSPSFPTQILIGLLCLVGERMTGKEPLLGSPELELNRTPRTFCWGWAHCKSRTFTCKGKEEGGVFKKFIVTTNLEHGTGITAPHCAPKKTAPTWA